MKTSSIPHDIVAMRACLIWMEAGKPDGQSLNHWYQAERELENEAALLRSFSVEEGRLTSIHEAIASPAFA